MRNYIVLISATALSACGGTSGPVTAGGAAVSAGPGTPNGATHSFVAPTVTKTYQAQGAAQYFQYDYTEGYQYDRKPALDSSGNPILDQNGNPVVQTDLTTRRLTGIAQSPQFYSANAGTVRNPGISVTYDPKNAQFTIILNQGDVKNNITFQDPLHRTDFSGLRTPQLGVPNLEIQGQTDPKLRGVQYLEAGTGTSDTVYDRSTFFYELPGTTTSYVTYAGYVRNHYEAPVETTVSQTATVENTRAVRLTRLERATFVFGETTSNSAVPTTGSATYTGNMIGSVINNPLFDTAPIPATYFQWMSGTGSVAVNFATGAVNTTINGVLGGALNDNLTSRYSGTTLLSPAANPGGITTPQPYMPAGATFTATGTGRIDLVTTGGFTGTFGAASFNGNGITQDVSIAGSTFDGAFYGPQAEEAGASFRIVGGIPDQRVDIIGVFTGKKKP